MCFQCEQGFFSNDHLGLVVLLLSSFVWLASSILAHSQFNYDAESGLIVATSKPELHLNAKGGNLQAGDPIVLYPRNAQQHELFDVGEDGLIHVGVNNKLCLNAEGGVAQDHRLITWACDEAADNERFVLNSDGRIRSKAASNLCINVKGGDLSDSAELILYPCATEQKAPNEVFMYEDRMIKLVSKPELHFNIAGAETQNTAPVVLYSYRPGKHEQFDFTVTGQLRVRDKQNSNLRGNRGFCLNAEGGLEKGHRIVLWPCSEKPNANELWIYNPTAKTILAREAPEIGFNVASAVMEAGTEIVLWDVEDHEL